MRCFVCGAETERGATGFGGLKGEGAVLAAAVCSEACADEARRFAPRRSAQRGPAGAGMAVAALGLATGGVFLATGRDLGRALLVLGLLGAGTTRLAYPDALPLGLARALGIRRASLLLQWAGVALGLAAVTLAAAFLLGL